MEYRRCTDKSSKTQAIANFLNSLQGINVGGKNLASKGPSLNQFISEDLKEL